MKQIGIIVCLVCAAIATASPQFVYAQTPAQADHGTSHQMMKGAMTEAEFVPMMIKHHQDGIEMARVEEERGSSAAVKGLAAKIRQSQEREIGELKAHAQHAAGAQGTAGQTEHGDHSKMMEQQSQATMKRLRSASGEALDHAFLEEMAKHHQMALHMIERTKFQSAELNKVAQKMAAGQREELKELKKLEGGHRPSK